MTDFYRTASAGAEATANSENFDQMRKGRFYKLREYRNEEAEFLPAQNFNNAALSVPIMELPSQYKLMLKQSKGIASLVPCSNESNKNIEDCSHSSLTLNPVSELEAVGSKWNVRAEHDGIWGVRLKELRLYKVEHGNCLVPARYSRNPKLANWVMTQRRQFNKMMKKEPSSLTMDRFELLEDLGFVWTVRKEFSTDWNQRYEELNQYTARHGDCIVPQNYPRNPQLGTWVSTQRIHYKRFHDGKQSSMTRKRIAALDSIGFSWVAYKRKSTLKNNENPTPRKNGKHGEESINPGGDIVQKLPETPTSHCGQNHFYTRARNCSDVQQGTKRIGSDSFFTAGSCPLESFTDHYGCIRTTQQPRVADVLFPHVPIRSQFTLPTAQVSCENIEKLFVEKDGGLLPCRICNSRSFHAYADLYQHEVDCAMKLVEYIKYSTSRYSY